MNKENFSPLDRPLIKKQYFTKEIGEQFESLPDEVVLGAACQIVYGTGCTKPTRYQLYLTGEQVYNVNQAKFRITVEEIDNNNLWKYSNNEDDE